MSTPFIRVDAIFGDITRERIRQETLREQGKFPATCATVGDEELSDSDCFEVLGEEVGEVARELTEWKAKVRLAGKRYHPREALPFALTRNGNLDHTLKLRAELIQVAAVAVAWVERIDFYRKDRNRE